MLFFKSCISQQVQGCLLLLWLHEAKLGMSMSDYPVNQGSDIKKLAYGPFFVLHYWSGQGSTQAMLLFSNHYEDTFSNSMILSHFRRLVSDESERVQVFTIN